MPENRSTDKKAASALQDHKADTFSFFARPLIFAVVTFCLLAVLFSLLIYQRYTLLKEAKIKEAYEIVNQAKDKLQETLTHSLSATKTLSFFIGKDGEVDDFDSIAAQILETSNDIDAIQLVPGGVIKYVYPLKGNEKVIGYNILQDTARNREAYKAIEKKEMFFAGPFELRQGGMGVVGRLPVYRNNKFWGYSAVVIKMSTLFKVAGIDSAGVGGFYFQLSKINPVTKETEYFLPVHKDQANNQSVSVLVPNGEWNLSVNRSDDLSGFDDLALLALLGFLLSVFGAAFAYRIAIRPRMLDRLVQEQTVHIKQSENKYRSVIERVSDAFVSLDKDWNYTYVNKKAGELLGNEPEFLVGKNIWTIYPDGKDQPFYHAYYRAMETQEYQYLEEYYPPFNKWFENHIYPSIDGLTIFFKDVTAIKQITLALKENEEKYRSLIEQASDGIVITDLEGNILEVNNSIIKMIGAGNEEMTGQHLTDYLPEEDVEIIPLRINELMQGKSLLYERRLLKRDGTYLAVEINSKMASTHTLIGFIRDISERKKYENTLLYQARLLDGVSDAITSLDMNRCIVSWNKACEELYGLKKEEALGKRIPELLTFEYPGTTNEEVFKKVYAEGQWKGDFNFTHPKTKIKTHLLSSLNILKNKDGEISGFIITSRDITERIKTEEALRKSNQRFELIAEATNDAVWDHDFVQNETWGNNKLYDLYGFEKGSQKINFGMFTDRIHPDDRPAIIERMQLTISNRVTSLSEVFRFRTASGVYKIFNDRAYIKYDDAGNAVKILGAMMDITETEEARKAIQESEEKFRTIIEQASDGIFIADENAYFLDVNTAGCKMTGYTLAELQKIRFLDIIPPEDLVNNPVRITNMKTGESVTNERRLVCKDGTIIDVEISAKKLPDGRYHSFARDITERKKAELALQQSAETYKVLVENAPEALVVFDVSEQKFVTVSETATKLFGMSKEELIKLGPVALSPEYQPDGRLSAEAAMTNIQKAAQGEKPVFEWTHCDKAGNLIPCEVWLVSLPSENDALIRGSIIDITERKKAEEKLFEKEKKLEQVLSSTIDNFYVIDVNYNVILINKVAERNLEIAWGKPVKQGTNLLGIIPEHGEEPIKENFIKAFSGESFEYELQLTRQGLPDWVNIRFTPVHDESETVIGVSVVAKDISERKKAEELLQKSYEDIRQLASNLQNIREDERTNIAREIHDELGQQLTGLKMDLHWLTKKINSADPDVNNKMTESINLINATIASVRKISTDLRPSILDDLGLVAALEWQSEEFEKRSGSLVKFINHAGDITVKPEITTAIFRIYQELLTNIARHANADMITAQLQKENDTLNFKINDNGTGFNLESIGNKKTLGLLGIKERTLILGGTYEFKSEPGKGSETVISIPLTND